MWLYKQELKCINTFVKRFHGTKEVMKDLGDQPHFENPSAGLTNFCELILESVIQKLIFNIEWTIGIKIKINDHEVITLNVYFLCLCLDNKDDYLFKYG